MIILYISLNEPTKYVNERKYEIELTRFKKKTILLIIY